METVQRPNRATYAEPVDAAGPGRLNMSHTRNTEQLSLLSCPSSLRGKKPQASSTKLDKSSGLGYHRINGKVQQRSRFVGPSHITNRRHAHLVRSSMRAARSTLESKPIKDLMKAGRLQGIGTRDQQPQAPSLKHQANQDKKRKHQAPSYKPQA